MPTISSGKQQLERFILAETSNARASMAGVHLLFLGVVAIVLLVDISGMVLMHAKRAALRNTDYYNIELASLSCATFGGSLHPSNLTVWI
jgi:hypothetical protein